MQLQQSDLNEWLKTIMISIYEIIKTLIHLGFIVYIETNKVENSQLIIDMLNIIDSSIDLIKLSPIKPDKCGCINKLFKR